MREEREMSLLFQFQAAHKEEQEREENAHKEEQEREENSKREVHKEEEEREVHKEEEEQEREENSKRVKEICEMIGYKFHNPIILQQAFTHHSYEEGCSSLERLAYIGDAILNFAIAKEQCILYPDLDPGRLTRLRASNVDTEKLARVALKHGLHRFLRHNIFFLGDQIDEFRDAIEEYPLHSAGLIDAPKVLADIVESLTGAIFMDCNNLDTTWEVAKKVLEPIIGPESVPIHPVTRLLEMCQSKRFSMKMRDTWKDDGVVEFLIHDQTFVAVGKAKYKPKRAIAKNRAALDAYNHILNLI